MSDPDLRMIPFPSPALSRRDLLKGSLIAGGMLLAGLDRICLGHPTQQPDVPSSDSATKLGTIDFTDEVPVPMGKAFGTELDGRLYTDFSQASAEHPITPTESFYVRTRASELLVSQQLTSIKIDGLLKGPSQIAVSELLHAQKPMGTHLMECAGNIRAIHFGLMSVAEWSGVPLSAVLNDARPTAEATRVSISGFDEYRAPSRSSMPGASWNFTIDELKSRGAFLATAINGQPLTKDHGAPVRLIVPGWYGCASIKWVNQITFMGDASESTSQMLEYASRTLQEGIPQFARDFRPATIDQAAMPIRIEKWKLGERINYRVVGIVWGGSQPIKKLEIQFNPDEEYVAVDSLRQNANDPWSFWTHQWTPKKPGTYAIRLRVIEPIVVTRRLDAGFYLRTVHITEV